MKINILHKLASYELLNSLLSLGLSKGRYAVFGSAPLWVHGIRDSIHDLDVVVDKKTFHELAESDKFKQYISRGVLTGDPLIRIPTEHGDIEIFYKIPSAPKGLTPEKIISKAKTYYGVPMASLEHVLEWKRNLGREKDLVDIKKIEAVLNRKMVSRVNRPR
ncbi:MAG: hypothetical protein ABIM30_00705 [candidate division WOR-3 bacterium]